jgi:hypothetical protein
MRFRTTDLRPHGWEPGHTLQIPDWCGCSTEYIPVPVGPDWGDMVRSGTPHRRRIRTVVGADRAVLGTRSVILQGKRPVESSEGGFVHDRTGIDTEPNDEGVSCS